MMARFSANSRYGAPRREWVQMISLWAAWGIVLLVIAYLCGSFFNQQTWIALICEYVYMLATMLWVMYTLMLFPGVISELLD